MADYIACDAPISRWDGATHFSHAGRNPKVEPPTVIIPDRPTDQEIAAARFRPNGHVVRIHRSLDPAGDIPREAVIGAWRVDGRGRIVGDFIVNPDYDPVRWPDDSVEDVVVEEGWPGLRRITQWIGKMLDRMGF
jgi:hypothetical protein